MARPNMKSVRLSDEALAIVESAPGEGFNDKFEKLIFAYSNTIPTRLAQLDAIEKKIDQKKQELTRLQEMESQVRRMVIDLEVIANLIPRINSSMESVSQKINQGKPDAREVEIHEDVKRYNKAFDNFVQNTEIPAKCINCQESIDEKNCTGMCPR